MSGIRFYSYRLTCKDFMIAFANKTTETNSHVWVKFSSGYLWSFGYEKAFERFMAWFEYFKAKIIGTRLSRLDICVDTDEATFNISDRDGFVTRAKNKETHYVDTEHQEGKAFSGFPIGSGKPLMARIYDKTREIKKSGKAWFEQIWKENGWDSNKPVWRIEFQLRRTVLKELQINQVKDIKNKEDKLWYYLTNDWLSLRVKEAGNVSRWEESSKWTIIRNAKNKKNISSLVREKVKLGNVEKLLDQTTGLMYTIAAVSNCKNIDQLFKMVKGWSDIKLHREGTDFKKKINERRKRFI